MHHAIIPALLLLSVSFSALAIRPLLAALPAKARRH